MLLNLFRDRWRRESKYRTIDLDQIGEVASSSSTVEELLEVKEVWKSLTKVPQDQQEALLAVVVAGLSYDEAAKSLQIPKGTLMSRISRARAKIRNDVEASGISKVRSVK